jgi:hypothetical protein
MVEEEERGVSDGGLNGDHVFVYDFRKIDMVVNLWGISQSMILIFHGNTRAFN